MARYYMVEYYLEHIKNKKTVAGFGALFFIAQLSAMDPIPAIDPELQVLVEQVAANPVKLEANMQAAGGGDGVQQNSPTKEEELYTLLGEHNRKFFASHDTQQVLRAFHQLKSEQHLSFMAVRQFDEVQRSGQGGLVMRRKHHAKPRATQHTGQHSISAQRAHSKSALGRKNLDRQNNNACEQAGELEEKEREQDFAELAKGKERAQAELTTVLLSVLSQQLKERVDQLAQEKEKSDGDHQEEVAKKDKCQRCLTATTTIVGILGVLATAWASVMTASCAEHNSGK